MIKKLTMISLGLVIPCIAAACGRNSSNSARVESAESVTLSGTPVKVERSRKGFSLEKYAATMDLSKSSVTYVKSGTQVCEGTLDINHDKDRWVNAVTDLTLCFKNEASSVTDGVFDEISLYFSSETKFSGPVVSSQEEGYTVVKLSPSFNKFVGGQQQYLCKEAFPLDKLMEDTVDCL